MNNCLKRTLAIIMVVIMTIMSAPIGFFSGPDFTIKASAATNNNAMAVVNNICSTVGFRPGVDNYNDCYAFASAFCKKMYGTAPGGTSGYTLTRPGSFYLVGQTTGTGVSASSLSALLSQAMPGDVVQMYWYTNSSLSRSSQHTAIVYSADSSSFTILQDGASWSTIQKSTYNYSSYYTRWRGSGYGISLYRHNNYNGLFGGSSSSQGAPVNLGNDFYAYIIKRDSWKLLEAYDGNVRLSYSNDGDNPKQIWRFIRQSNNSYKIINEYDGRCLDAYNSESANSTNIITYNDNGLSNQRWYIYNGSNGYNIFSSYCNKALDVNGGTSNGGENVHLWDFNNGVAQNFSIYSITNDGWTYSKPARPKGTYVKSSRRVGNNRTLTWDGVPLVDNRLDKRTYGLKIWKGKKAEGTEYKFIEGIEGTSYSLYLDEGWYTFRVVSFNSKYKSYGTIGNSTVFNVCNHNYQQTFIKKQASCISTGIAEYTCSKCGKKIEKSIPKKEHDFYYYKNEKEPTCTMTGTKVYYCTVCNETKTETIPSLGHSYNSYYTVDTPATCTYEGSQSFHCSRCNATTGSVTIAKSEHTYGDWVVTQQATETQTGVKVRQCKACGKYESETIKKLEVTTTPISKCTFTVKPATYTGKAVTPTLTVKNGKTTLKAGTHYTVTYKNNTKIGKATVTIKGIEKNGYSGTKTLTFNILPGVTKSIKATQSTSAVKLTWSRVAGATGYRVYRHDGKKWVKLADTKNTTYTVSKLKAGTNYKYAVKAYTTVGKTVYWSDSFTQLSTATKPATPAIKVTAGKKQATVSWNKITGATGYVVYYSTSKNGTYKRLATVKGTSYTAKKLTTGKTYYFKVAAYKTVGKANLYGSYSSVKGVKVK